MKLEPTSLPADFDYTVYYARARREQARAVNDALSAFGRRLGRLFGA